MLSQYYMYSSNISARAWCTACFDGLQNVFGNADHIQIYLKISPHLSWILI